MSKKKRKFDRDTTTTKQAKTPEQFQETHQQRQKCHLRIAAKKIFSSFVFWLTLAMSVAGFSFLVWPRISIYPGESLNPRDAFQTPFILKNDGYLPINDIHYTLTLRVDLTGVIIKDIDFAFSDVISKLGPNTSSSLDIDLSRRHLGNYNPNLLNNADIYLNLSCKLYPLPFSWKEERRFTTDKKITGEFVWSEYYGKTQLIK